MKEVRTYITKPFLPPLEEFIPYLSNIWNEKIITNCGPYHQMLEKELCEYLGVKYISLFTNGTIALITALQALNIRGEVITTPYSFVATSHSLLWNNITPVFVDIDEDTLNIDPTKIESAITPLTAAIMPVHCYGHPCDVEAIKNIAEKHKLKIIYDAAHAFGVNDKIGSVLNHGDLSILSFHATKVFNTFEGGAIICHDEKTKIRIDQLKNFGHVGETAVVEAGINGKMSEINAAMGLLQLKNIDYILMSRKKIDRQYRARLNGVKGIKCLSPHGDIIPNYSYFPILVTDEYKITRDELNDRFKEVGIIPRRYFYPLISDYPMYQDLPSSNANNLPIATKATKQVLCLPIYPDLDLMLVDEIVSSIILWGEEEGVCK